MKLWNQVARVAVAFGLVAGAFAQAPIADRVQDRRDIRQDQRDINQDKRQIRRDVRTGRPVAARRAARDLRNDRRDRNADVRDLRQDRVGR